jgi:protein SCO1/2
MRPPPKRDKDAGMRGFLLSGTLVLTLFLVGCGKSSFHMTDISGGMPKLEFRMVRKMDEIVTAQAYRGKVVALYFGYSHCPDVCPTTLTNFADVIDKVKNPDFKVLFVTVDPARDDGPTLLKYARAFSPQVDGLRSDNPNDLAALARRYRVAYSVKAGPPYEVMHANSVFFFDRQGEARLVTTDTNDTTAIAEDVKMLLQ